VRLQLGKRKRPGLAARDVDRQRVGDQPLEADLVERVPAGNLMGGEVDVRPHVVQEVKVRHRVPVALHDCDVAERRVREPWEDGHVVAEGVSQVEDSHRPILAPRPRHVKTVAAPGSFSLVTGKIRGVPTVRGRSAKREHRPACAFQRATGSAGAHNT
jgi:hypothetical protein